MASPEEARLAARSGADLVGLVGPMPSGAGIISPAMCRTIADSAPAWVTPVLLSSANTFDGLVRDIRAANVRAVQIVRHVDPDIHDSLNAKMPFVRRLQVVHVEDNASLAMLDLYRGRVDAFLLDSGRPSAGELGGTGRTHDWTVSAEFVARSDAPVFLAGGLDADNVADAISIVRPFGVDICSGVRTPDDELDPVRLGDFMAAVRGASGRI